MVDVDGVLIKDLHKKQQNADGSEYQIFKKDPLPSKLARLLEVCFRNYWWLLSRKLVTFPHFLSIIFLLEHSWLVKKSLWLGNENLRSQLEGKNYIYHILKYLNSTQNNQKQVENCNKAKIWDLLFWTKLQFCPQHPKKMVCLLLLPSTYGFILKNCLFENYRGDTPYDLPVAKW